MGFIFAGIAIIETATTGVLQTLGKFNRQLKPGFNFYIPLIEKVSLVSNRLSQQTFEFEVKTSDNVFAIMKLAVQYRITEENSSTALFSLDNPDEQIGAFIENEVRSHSSKSQIDQLFESQDSISQAVSKELSEKMKTFGYEIESVLVVNIDPNAEVKKSMNLINANKRLLEAAKYEADAKYISRVRDAEADRDRKHLQGQGTSLQRKAIIDGYRESIDEMSDKLNVSHERIIDFVVKTQHLDMLEQIGKSSNTKTIFMEHTPSSRLMEDISMANEGSK